MPLDTPLDTVTDPPTPLFVDPTPTVIDPAVDVSPTPVDNTRLPTVPREPDPLIIDTAPVLPDKAVPDDISIHPLAPREIAFAVVIVITPLEEDDPVPLAIVTDPPT